MSLTFREAKAQLNATSVAELRTLLEQVGRPTTEPISTEDFEMLRVIYPLTKQGMSVQEALNFYNETPQNNLPLIDEMFNTLRQEFIASNVEHSLRRDVKNFYLLYFQMWGDAMRSPEILNDPDVKAACKGAAISTLEAMQEINFTFLTSFRNRLRSKGFLPSINQPQLIEAEIDTQEAA